MEIGKHYRSGVVAQLVYQHTVAYTYLNTLSHSTFVWASKTKCHRLGALVTINIYFSQFWKLEVQDQDTGRFNVW